MKLYYSNDNSFIFVGDIHGDFKGFVHKLKQMNIDNVNIIICGDIGLGFHKKGYYINIFKKINKDLKKLNIVLWFFRGNHDNPEFFKNDELKQEILSKISNINILDDYDLIKHPNYTILVIGGGISIDRIERKGYYQEGNIKKREYWQDEIINDIPVNFIEEVYNLGIHNIDIICTHSAPDFCPPYGYKNLVEIFAKYDNNLLKDLQSERNLLSSIFNKMIYHFPLLKYWFYGHYHNSYSYEYKGVKFYGIDKFRIDSRYIDCKEMY